MKFLVCVGLAFLVSTNAYSKEKRGLLDFEFGYNFNLGDPHVHHQAPIAHHPTHGAGFGIHKHAYGGIHLGAPVVTKSVAVVKAPVVVKSVVRTAPIPKPVFVPAISYASPAAVQSYAAPALHVAPVIPSYQAPIQDYAPAAPIPSYNAQVVKTVAAPVVKTAPVVAAPLMKTVYAAPQGAPLTPYPYDLEGQNFEGQNFEGQNFDGQSFEGLSYNYGPGLDEHDYHH